MTRAHKSLVALVALAAGARGAGPSKAVLRLASLFRDRCGDARLYWYEDVVDRPDAWATIMYQLGLWPAPDASRLRGTTLKNTTHVVHGALPVRRLISNYDKVARALRPTKFKWMLE